jgi:hypothetical protein
MDNKEGKAPGLSRQTSHKRHASNSLHGTVLRGGDNPLLDAKVRKEMNMANGQGFKHRVIVSGKDEETKEDYQRVTIVTTAEGKYIKKYFG